MGVGSDSDYMMAMLDDFDAHDPKASSGRCEGTVLFDGQPRTSNSKPGVGSTIVADFTCPDLVVNKVHYEVVQGHVSTMIRTPK